MLYITLSLVCFWILAFMLVSAVYLGEERPLTWQVKAASLVWGYIVMGVAVISVGAGALIKALGS